MKKDLNEPTFLKAHPTMKDSAYLILGRYMASENRDWIKAYPYVKRSNGEYERASDEAQVFLWYKKAIDEMVDVRREPK